MNFAYLIVLIIIKAVHDDELVLIWKSMIINLLVHLSGCGQVFIWNNLTRDGKYIHQESFFY